jgi:hypothetical protein
VVFLLTTLPFHETMVVLLREIDMPTYRVVSDYTVRYRSVYLVDADSPASAEAALAERDDLVPVERTEKLLDGDTTAYEVKS